MSRVYVSDKIHEECGVFGVYAPSGENVAPDIYNGLIALQHRGQEAAGISVSRTDGPRGKKKEWALSAKYLKPVTLSG